MKYVSKKPKKNFETMVTLYKYCWFCKVATEVCQKLNFHVNNKMLENIPQQVTTTETPKH